MKTQISPRKLDCYRLDFTVFIPGYASKELDTTNYIHQVYIPINIQDEIINIYISDYDIDPYKLKLTENGYYWFFDNSLDEYWHLNKKLIYIDAYGAEYLCEFN